MLQDYRKLRFNISESEPRQLNDLHRNNIENETKSPGKLPNNGLEIIKCRLRLYGIYYGCP